MSKGSRKNRTKGTKPQKPLVSVCLIARNEEQNLDRCLRSVKPIADEIIYVDTGSTDGSVEIARQYTDKIWIHPWNDSFSEARNHYLKYATGEWVFQIDADEELVADDIPRVRQAVLDKRIDAIMVQIISRLRSGRSEGVHCVERIFRNNGVIHYEGRVHNRLVGVKEAKVYTIRLFHYGYDLGAEASRKKFQRTVSLLKMDLEDDPHNPMTYHYLGCSYLTQGMFLESIEASRKAIDLAESRKDSALIYLWSHYNAAMSCYKLKNLAEAESFCLAALRKYPNHVDSHFVLCLVYFDQKIWEKMISHGHEYLRLAELQEREPGLFGNLVTCSLKEKWNILALSGVAHSELGQENSSDEAFQKALNQAPEPLLVARAAGVFFYNKGMLAEARIYLEKADRMPGSDETVRQLLKEIGTKTGMPQKEPTISCCMIVKDEEAFLGQCLESVKDFVDEIVVVDTGSTDGTVEIARQFTDKIYFHPWEGSFSKARNQALTYATGDWIFQIDADEELVSGNGERLREVVQNAGKADAIHVNIISSYSNGAKRARHNFERLFRNNGVIHYEGIVHNRIEGARFTKASRIEVMHYGYNVDEKTARKKFLRTSALLKKQISANPGDPMPHHYLGTSYLSRNMIEEAIKELVKAIDLAEQNNDDNPLYLWSHHNVALALFSKGDLDQARTYSLRAIEKCPKHLDSFYLLTMLAAERNEWEEVVSMGCRYLKLQKFFDENPDQAGLIVNSTLNERPGIHLLLGHAFHALKDYPKMSEHYQKAYEISDKKFQVWYNAGCFHMDRSQDFDRAWSYLNSAFHESPDNKDVLYMLAKLYSKRGMMKEEKECLEKLWELGTEDPVILNRLAALCRDADQMGVAIRALEKVIALDPSNYQALCCLGGIQKELGELGKATGYFQSALALSPEDSDPWLHLGEICLKTSQLEEARVFFEHVMGLRPDEIMALLCLCEIELKENRFIEFVNSCDSSLEKLQLSRHKEINSLEDMVGVLEEIREAVKDRPRLSSQSEKVLALLRLRIKEFAQTIGKTGNPNPIQTSSPAY